MKITYFTNLPSPYRVEFFNELAKHCSLTVFYERKSANNRDEKWIAKHFLNYTINFLKTFSIGNDSSLGFDAIRQVCKDRSDILIFAGWSSPSIVLALAYCSVVNKPYILESDGAFAKKDGFIARNLKRFILKSNRAYLSTCESAFSYMETLGIKRANMFKSPFSSMMGSEILSAVPSALDRSTLRNKLGLPCKNVALSIGQFKPHKGYDLLLKAAAQLRDINFVIVGGEPTKEYHTIVEADNLTNVYFYGFKEKRELSLYYQAADFFVFPTRGDVWGLVVNEAMSFGLPVITTDRCNAGLELIRENVNGFVISMDSLESLTQKIQYMLEDESRLALMSQIALETAREYSIENMVKAHLDAFKAIINLNNKV